MKQIPKSKAKIKFFSKQENNNIKCSVYFKGIQYFNSKSNTH